MRINRLNWGLLFSVSLFVGCADESSEGIHDPNAITMALCKYPNNKRAALSITFDDGCSSVFNNIVPMLNSYNLKGTFFIIAGHVEIRNEWERWKSLLAQGHEIGNHSLTHAYYLGPQKDTKLLQMEIDSSFNLITSRLGKSPFSFGHPFHSTSPTADNIVFERHHSSKFHLRDFAK